MPAVVRVKRRIDEEPLSSFVLNGKRRRLNEEEQNAATSPIKDEISTLLKFAGTIKEQDDTATTQFARLTKEEAKELVLQKAQRPLNATAKARQEMREHQQEQRFRVVNRLRTTLDMDDNANDRSKEITIVDIEKHTTNANKTADDLESLEARSAALANLINNLNEASTSAAAATAAAAAMTMPTDSDTGYVYDLYIPENEQQADYVDLMDDNYLRVQPFDDLVYEDRYNNDDDDSFDSDDSNDENHAGNEYPDEDDDAALNSDLENEDKDDDGPTDLSYLLQRVGLNESKEKGAVEGKIESEDEYNYADDSDCDTTTMASESDYDSDVYAYEDPYCHVLDPEGDTFLNDVDFYGMAYARYKARVLHQAKLDEGELDDENEINASDTDHST